MLLASFTMDYQTGKKKRIEENDKYQKAMSFGTEIVQELWGIRPRTEGAGEEPMTPGKRGEENPVTPAKRGGGVAATPPLSATPLTAPRAGARGARSRADAQSARWERPCGAG